MPLPNSVPHLQMLALLLAPDHQLPDILLLEPLELLLRGVLVGDLLDVVSVLGLLLVFFRFL